MFWTNALIKIVAMLLQEVFSDSLSTGFEFPFPQSDRRPLSTFWEILEAAIMKILN